MPITVPGTKQGSEKQSSLLPALPPWLEERRTLGDPGRPSGMLQRSSQNTETLVNSSGPQTNLSSKVQWLNQVPWELTSLTQRMRVTDSVHYLLTMGEETLQKYMIPFIWSMQNRQIHRDRKQISDCQGLERWNEEWLLLSMGFIFDVSKIF